MVAQTKTFTSYKLGTLKITTWLVKGYKRNNTQ